MTAAQIRAMFAVGQSWTGMRSPGRLGADVDVTARVVDKVQGNAVKFTVAHADPCWTYFPKAADVIEARDGFLHFRIPKPSGDITVKLYREAS